MSSHEVRGQNKVTHATWKLKSSVPAMEPLRLSQICCSIHFFHSHSDLFYLFHMRLHLRVLPVHGPCANWTRKVYPNSWAFDVGFATWFSYQLFKIISTIFFSHDIWFSVCTWIGLPGEWQNKMSLWVFPPHKSGSQGGEGEGARTGSPAEAWVEEDERESFEWHQHCFCQEGEKWCLLLRYLWLWGVNPKICKWPT